METVRSCTASDSLRATASASTATGGREGRARSSDRVLDVQLSTPRELGGAGGPGTNPEQLFAAGYSACFLGALKFVAGKQKVALPADTTVTGKIGIGAIPAGFGIEAELTIAAPGVPARCLGVTASASAGGPLLDRRRRCMDAVAQSPPVRYSTGWTCHSSTHPEPVAVLTTITARSKAPVRRSSSTTTAARSRGLR